MGITFRHDAAAGLIGAYGAGLAANQRRKQKYMMDILEKQRDRNSRLGGVSNRNGRSGVRGGAGGGDQLGGRWVDPMVEIEADPSLTEAEKYRMRRIRQSQMHAARGSKLVKSEGFRGNNLMPYWQSPEEVDAIQQRENERIA